VASEGVRVRVRWAAVAIVGSLVAAGCGSGGGSSRSDYLRKVNSLCRESASERRTLVPTSGNANVAQVEDALQRSVAVDEQLEQRITAVKPPKELAASTRRLLDLMRESDQTALRIVTTIKHNDIKGFNILYDELKRIGGEIQDAANRAGATACVQKQ
jgi:hypothetical protein